LTATWNITAGAVIFWSYWWRLIAQCVILEEMELEMSPGTNRWNVQQHQANLVAYEARRSALRTNTMYKVRGNGLEEFIETAVQVVWIPEKTSIPPVIPFCPNVPSARHVWRAQWIPTALASLCSSEACSTLSATALRFLLKHICWMANTRTCLSRSVSII